MATRPIGRPRESGLEQRVFVAACAIYAKRGWAGFNFDEVARRSRVGKGSLYLRWRNKAQMLFELVQSRTDFIAGIDTGHVRTDLIEFARRWCVHLETDEGVLTYRLTIDARFYPELRKALGEKHYPEHVRSTRAIIRRGIERGELPPGTSIALVADLVAGAVSNHVRNTPDYLRDGFADHRDEYCAMVVDTVLQGISAGHRPRAPE
ncbi:TetR/AcrR family transcriptional regulator [Pollutimonas harenae]|uniref:TetR/AcrR family transcriptional regulator n=1 Tax=Pollutimonas harenae TaxID=657015 RepID=A0A853GPY8_9BURK|nr:TetR/AcrR family transcriptional regulator [Pollutimonas harenae]NYT84171.1 TetR/AcrR family transcriptional regulator [Pollutimonas harenae]TEA73413.1 TetR/AcrR family transcriptional regulator [Pollutimonas harenae]